MTSYQAFHKRSIEDRNGFWGEQAELIHWNKKPEQIYDFSKPPFVKWFVGGETNLCYNAVDRHAEAHPDAQHDANPHPHAEAAADALPVGLRPR